ncbi:MAG TPA: DUF493 domain-containing protein [Acidiferrobacteraceae bacterium]|nr:DUF493 domain-containing protein [Acidiferrobacteraceae bacterium]
MQNGKPVPDPNAYPCTVYVKVMGRKSLRFEALIQALVAQHVRPEALLAVSRRDSRESHYSSLTFTIRAQSRAQLDALYQSLKGCPEVLLAL